MEIVHSPCSLAPHGCGCISTASIPLKEAPPQLSSRWAPFGPSALRCCYELPAVPVPGHLATPAGSCHPAHFAVDSPVPNCLILFFS